MAAAVRGQTGFHDLADDSSKPLDLRREVERLRLEVHMAHIGSGSVEETALAIPEAALASGFNCPDDFVVRERTLDYYGGGDRYQGEALGNLRHGRGVFSRANGDRYEGDWRYDLREGRGVAEFASGLRYDGEWLADKAEGKGRARYENGGEYEGDWRQDHRWGWGVHVFPNGDRYDGEWVDDKIEGQGRHTFTDGSYYEGQWRGSARVKGRLVAADGSSEYSGEWRGNQRHGHGVQYQRGMFQYVGEWADDLQHGEGKCTYADGSAYNGQWKEGLRSGVGKLTFRGYSYQGQWQDDKPHGRGWCNMDNGDRYVGEFQAGKRHGQGQAAFADGSKYEGEWAEDRQCGKGICIYANGDKYQGQWKDGRRHGRGVCRFADGTKFKGEWEDDGWVQSAAEPARCRVAGPGVTRATAGRPAEFLIQARDEDGNRRLSGGEDFGALLRGPANVAASVVDKGDGTYALTYTATVAGVYQLEVTLGGEEQVADSPYPLRVLPAAPCARRCAVAGEGRSAAVAGAPAEFRVCVHDEYGNSWAGEGLEALLPLEASLSSGAAEVEVQLEASREGGYVGRYTPCQPGFYRLHLACRGAPLPGTPFSVQVRPSGAGADAVDDVSPAAGRVDPVLAASLGGPVRDESRLWAEIAALQYAADGGTDGWDSGGEEAAAAAARRQSPEDAYIKAHPDVPVVENLEDIWLVSKMQRERKEREARAKERRLQAVQKGLEGAFGSPAEGPAPAEVAAEVRQIVAADLRKGAAARREGGAAAAPPPKGAAPRPAAQHRPAVADLRAAVAALEELD